MLLQIKQEYMQIKNCACKLKVLPANYCAANRKYYSTMRTKNSRQRNKFVAGKSVENVIFNS